GHLLLGMLKETDCAGRKLLLEAGATALDLEQAASEPHQERPLQEFISAALAKLSSTGFRDLTAKARDGVLGPLIGRERELESIIRILCRRTRKNAVLVGEGGVGKNAIIEGLARGMAAGEVPANLADRPLLAVDASQLAGVKPVGRIPDDAIVYVRGLFDL